MVSLLDKPKQKPKPGPVAAGVLLGVKAVFYTYGALCYALGFIILLLICVPFPAVMFAGIDSVYAIAGPGIGFIALFVLFAFLERKK